jgi:hypothetical protein
VKLHQAHDLYAPLVNRRLEFDYVKKVLKDHGFTDVIRTVKDTELYIRAVKTKMNESDNAMPLTTENNIPWALKPGR